MVSSSKMQSSSIELSAYILMNLTINLYAKQNEQVSEISKT